MRPALVAEAPARGRPDAAALDGPSGDRLAGYLGTDRARLLELFSARNLLGRWPGAQGKGSAWPVARARRAAAREPLHGVAVLLGSRVAGAYGLGDLDWGEWRELPHASVALIPHPSGVCRAYNASAMRSLAGEVLREALHLSGSSAINVTVPDRQEQEVQEAPDG